MMKDSFQLVIVTKTVNYKTTSLSNPLKIAGIHSAKTPRMGINQFNFISSEVSSRYNP